MKQREGGHSSHVYYDVFGGKRIPFKIEGPRRGMGLSRGKGRRVDTGGTEKRERSAEDLGKVLIGRINWGGPLGTSL